jgi:hypothetical protein
MHYSRQAQRVWGLREPLMSWNLLILTPSSYIYTTSCTQPPGLLLPHRFKFPKPM